MNVENIFEDAILHFSEEVRLNTYKNWVFDDDADCNAEKMAEAGFVFIGNKEVPDLVQCFFCDKQLDSWESTDDPWKEHVKHAPQCKFAKLQKSQIDITLQEALNLRRDYLMKIADQCDNMIGNLKNVLKKAKIQLKK